MLPACHSAAVLGGRNLSDGGRGAPSVSSSGCDLTHLPGLTVAQLQAEYLASVDPLFQDSTSGCGTCHGAASGRPFILTPDAQRNFHSNYSAGLLGTAVGGALDRLTATGAPLMPPNNPWPAERIAPVASFACEAQALFAATPPDEQFPADLLQPYTGPALNYYDNTFLNFPQLKGKVLSVFNDSWIRDGGTDLFQANIGPLGGVDFQTQFNEARVATPDFLLALEGLARDVCSQAVVRHTGPFVGIDTLALLSNTASTRANISTLYQRILFRPASPQEQTDASLLLQDLSSYGALPDPWAGLCEALVKHPDFLFTLPPSRAQATDGSQRAQLLLVKTAQDLLARPPSAGELSQFVDGGASYDSMLDQYLSSSEFQKYFFYKMRIRTESDATADGDEPARLWTYLMVKGKPFQDLLTGDYSVDPGFQKISRDPVHGQTGLLTMKGFIQHKPGLPHYNYAARVLSDFMGYIFEVPQSIISMRLGATASSTVDPKSVCYSCHQLLTPLAYQRASWDDKGNPVTVDAQGQPLDDTDRGLVPSYEYKGKGIPAFAAAAARKERFSRQMMNSEYLLLFGRTLRYDQDERLVYKQLWDVGHASDGNLRETMKTMMKSPSYQGP